MHAFVAQKTEILIAVVYLASHWCILSRPERGGVLIVPAEHHHDKYICRDKVNLACSTPLGCAPPAVKQVVRHGVGISLGTIVTLLHQQGPSSSDTDIRLLMGPADPHALNTQCKVLRTLCVSSRI